VWAEFRRCDRDLLERRDARSLRDRTSHRLEQELSRLHDSAADHDPLRAEENEDVRDREPDQVAGALKRVRRLARYVQIGLARKPVSVPFDLTSFKKS
jgi:hypothetical protein